MQLVELLKMRHIVLSLSSERKLSVTAPRGAVTGTIVTGIKKYQGALMDMLEQQEAMNASTQP